MVIGFAAMILIGAGLLTTPLASATGTSIGFFDALFTATSAVCVTGLVVVDTGAAFSAFGKTVLLLLIQAGGLGFMIFATLAMVALGRRISLRNRVLIRESMGTANFAGLVRVSLWFGLIAGVIEGVGACVLAIRFIPLYGLRRGVLYSVFHAVSAFCNAGFDILGGFGSVARFQQDPLVLVTLALLIILGGIGFSVMLECVRHRGRFRTFSLHTKLVLCVTAVLLACGTAFVALLEWNNPATLGRTGLGVGDKLVNAFFQSATLRTAGFAAVDQAALSDASKLLSVLFMFIGASPASTGGGVKTTTACVLVLMAVSVIRGQEDVNVFGKRLTTAVLRRAITMMSVGIALVLSCGMALSVIEGSGGKPLIDLIFEAASAFATTGLSSVGTPSLHPASRAILIPMMFLGRVGPLTMAFAMATRLNRGQNRFHYPEEKIMIG